MTPINIDIDINAAISLVQAKLPTAFAAVVQEVGLSVAGQTKQWLLDLATLFTTDPQAALAQLAAARTNAQRVADTERLAKDAQVWAADEAATRARWTQFFADALHATMIVVGALATVVL